MPNSSPSQLQHADLDWDAQGQPRSRQYGDIYFSQADGLGESTHVFLDGNALAQRWQQTALRDFVIGELGFGSGLNFLNACRLWCATAPPTATLHYLACELHPWHLNDLRRLHAQWPELAPWLETLLAQYPEHSAGIHQLVLHFGAHRVCLSLLYGDATMLLPALRQQPGLHIDSWFLDGFAPRHNPALWSAQLLRDIAALSHTGTTLSSYSVAAPVRQALHENGYAWERLPGYAGKRHMLKAWLPEAPPRPTRPRGHVCVVGGGLAGCSTAFTLAENGWRVTLLERTGQIASTASGNPQGILHCKPARVDSPGQRLNLLGFQHAARHYHRLRAAFGLAWHDCGMLQLAVTPALEKRFRDIANSGLHAPQLLRHVDAATASALAGQTLNCGGLYFPDAGWLSPPTLCALYANQPGITLRHNCKALALHEDNGGWTLRLRENGKDALLHCDRVVLCNSSDLGQFTQTQHYPLIVNRGQVDLYPATPASRIDLILCGPGYLLPAGPEGQCVGGSYYLGAQDTQARAARSHWHRLQLAAFSPPLAAALSKQAPLIQRLGTRCVTPDRMPLLGQATRAEDQGGTPWRGLYLNVGHGSHGLTRTPLCAALLAAELGSLPPPLTADLTALLKPARFL